MRTILIENKKSSGELVKFGSLNGEMPITDDEVIVRFGEGDFYVNKDIALCFNGCKKVIITGCGDETRIFFGKETIFKNDDSLIKIAGTKASPTSVIISDLVLIYAKDYGEENQGEVRCTVKDQMSYLIKCYYVKGFTMTNVRTELEDLKATNLDLRNCTDVDINNCTFINYNRCSTGGCLWLRGDVESVSVHDNVFRKHGNDELFAVWNNNKLENVDYNEDQHVAMRDIHFFNNHVFYQADGGSWNGSCNVLLTVSTNQEFMVRQPNVSGGDVDVADTKNVETLASVALPGDIVTDAQKYAIQQFRISDSVTMKLMSVLRQTEFCVWRLTVILNIWT